MKHATGRTLGMGEIVEVAGKPYELAPFGHALAALADERPEIVGLTADMGRYSDILPFRDAHPERFFNIGMAEQDMVQVSAGLAKVGKIAYCTTYAAFVTRRAYDFVAIACAHSRANVKIFAGTPGFVNGYGATHQATEDLSMMRGIADLTIIDPCDATELKQVVRAVAEITGTVYVRNIRGKVPIELDPANYRFTLGKAQQIRSGDQVGIISTGFMSARARDAANEAAKRGGIEAAVLHVSTIKPFDHAGVLEFARHFPRLIVAENHKASGGLCTLLVETLYDAGLIKPLVKVALADSFFECGAQGYLEEKYGMDEARIVKAILDGR